MKGIFEMEEIPKKKEKTKKTQNEKINLTANIYCIFFKLKFSFSYKIAYHICRKAKPGAKYFNDSGTDLARLA